MKTHTVWTKIKALLTVGERKVSPKAIIKLSSKETVILFIINVAGDFNSTNLFFV